MLHLETKFEVRYFFACGVGRENKYANILFTQGAEGNGASVRIHKNALSRDYTRLELTIVLQSILDSLIPGRRFENPGNNPLSNSTEWVALNRFLILAGHRLQLSADAMTVGIQ